MRPRVTIFWLCLFLVVATAILTFYGATHWLGDPLDGLPQIPFDELAWKNAKASGHAMQAKDDRDVRLQMIQDLLNRYSFKGWTSEQVIALLGQPDDPGEITEWDLIYGLGIPPGFFALDFQNLGFRLDLQRRVTEYGLFLH